MPITLPKGMSEDQADSWFGTRTTGRFNPAGAVSQLWASLERFPELTAIEQDGSAEFYRFADGTVFQRSGAGAAPKIVAARPEGNELPAGVSLSLLRSWFGTRTTGRFNPERAVSQLWLTLGRFPELIAIDQDGLFHRDQR